MSRSPRLSCIDLAPGPARQIEAVFGGRRLFFGFPGSGGVPSDLRLAIGGPSEALAALVEDAWQFHHVYEPILYGFPDLPAEHVTNRRSKVSYVDAVLRSPRCAIENYVPLAAKILKAGLTGLAEKDARFDESWPK